MLKKITLILVITILSFISPVYAAEEENSDQNINDKIITIWNKDAAPFLKGVACSFKEDVWDKTTIWLEKNNLKKKIAEKEQPNTEITIGNKEENNKKCTFFEAIHKAIIGKLPTTNK